MSEVSSWDGWKILLQQLNLDFDLPRTRFDDPFYVPTPPEAKIDSIGATGKVRIEFSEPVFILDNVLTRTMGFGRRLQSADNPYFLDVQVIPGDPEIDPSLLDMTVTSTWPND